MAAQLLAEGTNEGREGGTEGAERDTAANYGAIQCHAMSLPPSLAAISLIGNLKVPRPNKSPPRWHCIKEDREREVLSVEGKSIECLVTLMHYSSVLHQRHGHSFLDPRYMFVEI